MYWRVKITNLPRGIQSKDLASKFNVPENEIYIYSEQTGKTWFGWVAGFPTEAEANQFVRRWENERFSNLSIRCKAVDDPKRPTTQSMPRQCRNGQKCYNPKCLYDHPNGWEACEDGADCDAFFCQANHPPGRVKQCPKGMHCPNGGESCDYLHPKPGEQDCLDGIDCRQWQCSDWHPKKRPKDCSNEERCWKTECSAPHPPNRREPCSAQDLCMDVDCPCAHPPNRPRMCHDGVHCPNYYCDSLHPFGWDLCPQGEDCKEADCPHQIHPVNPFHGLENQVQLKTKEQREQEREQNALPILASREEFCRRLRNERVLVVTAETGGGKSTQLPQYAAEVFKGLVVCTEPRVIAAMSLAHRVAEEYDGTKIGYSVGYRVGLTNTGRGRNRVPGRDIIFMTDGAFIQESMEDDRLDQIRVLIIDEAHERSLNTDIVMGIARLLLQKRPDDFYVVIASATIDPSKFLEFFGRKQYGPLEVPGVTFEVTTEKCERNKQPIVQQVVSVLHELYDQHEGNTLVFLSGQREIDQAIELFSKRCPKDCAIYPLYSSLSLEDQEQVTSFIRGPNGEARMVVFCTNIAETSLTVPNVRLILDSGLAREPNFDQELRVIFTDIKLISKASANQRKGRAGRTAPGHCVRFYDYDSLPRDHIEPAFKRSSIDSTVLQLLYLDYDPVTFPFVDQPSQQLIENAMKNLQELECIDDNRHITRRGQLFARLNLDPRYCAFLVDSYLEHKGILDLTTTIIGIFTAPAPIFVMGVTDDEKREARSNIAKFAADYDSDLLYHASLYKGWRSAAIAIDPTTGHCPVCKTRCVTGEVCRSCQVSFSAMRRLNNKIFSIIENLQKQLIKTIENPRWHLEPALTTEKTESEIIAAHLSRLFPEHRGRLVSSQDPSKGALVGSQRMRATINNISTYMQRRDNHREFLAMSISRLPNGFWMIDQLHPIPSSETNDVAERTSGSSPTSGPPSSAGPRESGPPSSFNTTGRSQQRFHSASRNGSGRLLGPCRPMGSSATPSASPDHTAMARTTTQLPQGRSRDYPYNH